MTFEGDDVPPFDPEAFDREMAEIMAEPVGPGEIDPFGPQEMAEFDADLETLFDIALDKMRSGDIEPERVEQLFPDEVVRRNAQ